MISLGIFTLLRHPERMAELRERPELLPAAVDELLRFLSVADGMLRVATQDIETPSHVIRAGEGVIFSNSAMNRDDAVFDDPDVLRWNRPTRHHGAFGYGMHQCLGQNLARAEMEIALTALLNRFSELRLAVPVEYFFQDGIFGPGSARTSRGVVAGLLTPLLGLGDDGGRN